MVSRRWTARMRSGLDREIPHPTHNDMSQKKKTQKVEMVVFRNSKGEPIFAVPGNMTLKQWCEMGLPNPSLVPKNAPWKENELRAP